MAQYVLNVKSYGRVIENESFLNLDHAVARYDVLQAYYNARPDIIVELVQV